MYVNLLNENMNIAENNVAVCPHASKEISSGYNTRT